MKTTSKHAYCIMAHGGWEQLQMLLDVLDDARNDIFLHIDAKSIASFENIGGHIKLQYSKLYYAKSVDVRWSDITQVDAEYNLFKAVLNPQIQYSRVHFISGVDLPIVSQDYIHQFFDKREDEFIDIRQPKQFEKRLKYYHFLVRYRRNRPLVDFIRRLLLLPQILFVNRLKNASLHYAYGANWCSLTFSAIKEIVAKYPKYRYVFKYTTSPDEHYKQMILSANPKFTFAKEGCMRYVVFSPDNPSPKTLTMDDYENVIQSGCLFARKFDINVDKDVINKIINKIL